MPVFPGSGQSGLDSRGLMVDQVAVAVVAIHRNQDVAGGIRGSSPAGFPAETAEYDRVDHAQASTGQHRDRQLRGHRQVNGHAIAGLQPCEITQQCRHFVYAHPQILVGHYHGSFTLGFRHEDDGSLVLVLVQMAVNAVIADVEFSAHEPFPERWIAGHRAWYASIRPNSASQRIPGSIPGSSSR